MDVISRYEAVENIEEIWKSEGERKKTGTYAANFPAIPTIPTSRYIDRRFFDLEQKWLWDRVWLFVGHESEIPEPGCYINHELNGRPISVVRDRDGSVNAFHNACRHRGAKIFQGQSGKVTNVTCLYHCWSYNLKGELQFVPDEHDFLGLDKSKTGLKEIRCELHRGLIFINLSEEEPQPLTDFLGSMVNAIADVPLEGAKVIRRVDYSIPVNWKAAQDAFSEAYHSQFLHAETVNPFVDARYQARYLFANGHSAMLLKTRVDEDGAALNVFDREDSAANGSTMRPITRKAQRAYVVFPNLTLPVAENTFPILSVWPQGPDQTRYEIRFIKMGGAVESAEADQAVIDGFLRIADEDLSVLNEMQASLTGGGVPEIILGYGEQGIAHYNIEFDRVIGIDRIPSELRVQSLPLPVIDPT